MSIGEALYNLGNMVQSQLSAGENQNHSLDQISSSGQITKYGKLGDFAKQIDTTAERSYTEEGFFRHNNFKAQPKGLELLTQEPDATIIIKKRAFSSLSENFRSDLMDDQERLLYKATKILFQNKCNQISAYEKLIKIEKIASDLGYLDSSLLPIISNTADFLASTNDSSGGNVSKFQNIINILKKASVLSARNITTTWTPDLSLSYNRSQFGEGTGTIEFTNMVNFNTNTSIRTGEGSCSLRFSDPYELMLISNVDIEKAISDASNQNLNNNYFQIGLTSLQSAINTNIILLKTTRQSRGAGDIIFKLDPNTFLGKRVRALFQNSGFEIQFDYSELKGLIGLNQSSNNIDPSALFGSIQVGNDGLKPNEISIFNDIISGYYKLIELQTNSQSIIRNNNTDSNYIRKKLRLFYGNKYVIQPMDIVHIYIGSKAKFDDKVLGGLQNSFNQLNFSQALNTSVGDISNYLNVNNSASIEKSIFVGADFPNALWSVLRNQFVNVKNGAHVFAGVVFSSSGSYSNGAHNVSINARDNFEYFNNGIVNFKPSLDIFNGPLYDPLTPFKLEFDSLTGVQKDGLPTLLDENKQILSSSSFIKNKQGTKAGQVPNNNNILSDYDRAPDGSISKVYYDPDGFVYRWKEGIATYVLFGDNYNNPISPATPIAITEKIFAGQDTMNILSLLICGEPYNYATFFKGAQDFDSIGRDPITGQDSSVSFFKTLKLQLQKRNYLYGNFTPFKRLVMDESSFTNILNSQLNIQNFDSNLNDLLQQRAALADKAVIINRGQTGAINDPVSNDLAIQIANLDSQISAKQSQINTQLTNSSNNIKIAGNDISFDTNSSLNISGNDSLNDPNIRKDLRRKINFLTQRLLWKVKDNQDKNYLIVDDTYDKDYDIQQFEKAIVGNLSMFQSQFETPAAQIKNIADVLDLEVFADSQGHIQIRVPQYNRVPSSVFYRMIKQKHEQGIEIFPKFLEDLFVNQLQNIIQNLETIEDQIRIDCALLGNTTDGLATAFIQGTKPTNGDAIFQFISGSDGKILSGNLDNLKLFADPVALNQALQQSLNLFSPQNSLTNVFSTIQQSKILINSSNVHFISSNSIVVSNQLPNVNNSDVITYINSIKSRIYMNTGQQVQVDTYNPNITDVEKLKIIQDISTNIGKRQKLIKSAVSAMKTVEEGININENIDNAANKLLYPNLYGNSSIPESFAHMIEDESFDDLGAGSAQRYVIKNSQIISLTINETPPDFTAVTVSGSFGDLFIPEGSLPQDLNVFQGGGNALTTVAAVDYDLWRMYGVKIPRHLDKPFITDPQSQGAPYAVSLLNRVRGEILKGDLTIVGNEYMQAGEVYYLEDRDLLIYAETVSHNFGNQGVFQTSISFNYAHNPGEYIPTPLDIIGKVFYKNKDTTNLINYRQDNVYNQDHVGIFVTQMNDPSGDTFDLTDGEYGTRNIQVVNNMLYTASAILSQENSDYKPILEIRTYFNSKDPNFASENDDIENVANKLRTFLTGNGIFGSYTYDPNNPPPWLKPEQVIFKAVDIGADDEFRYISNKAFAEARNIANSSASNFISLPADPTQKTNNIIYNFIIDCWITTQNV